MDELEKMSEPNERAFESVNPVQVVSVTEAIPPDTSKANSSKPMSKARWWTSLPILTLIAIVFYAQGRALTEAYLNYFGLNSSQFPVSPDDAYWYAFMGWEMVAGKGPLAIWHVYPSILAHEWMPMTITLVIPLVVLAGRRWGWWVRIGHAIISALSRFDSDRRLSGRSREVAKHIVIGGFPALMIALTPLLVLLFTLGLAFFIVVFVSPFWTLGRYLAELDCASVASSHQVVHYVGEPTLDSSGKPLPPSRLLQCGPEFCALIRDGASLVIPRTAIQSVEGAPIGKKNASSPVPEDLQFCHGPSHLSNPRGTASAQR